MYVFFLVWKHAIREEGDNEWKNRMSEEKKKMKKSESATLNECIFFSFEKFSSGFDSFLGGGNGEAVYCCVEWSVMCVFGGGVHFKQFGWMGSLGFFLLLEWNRIKRTSVCIFMRVFCFPWEKIRHNVNCLLCILIIILGKRW